MSFIGQLDLIIHVVWIVVRAVGAMDGHAVLFDNFERVSVADPVATRAEPARGIAGLVQAAAASWNLTGIIRPARPLLGTEQLSFGDPAAVSETW